MEKKDLPEPGVMPIDAWISACVDGGVAPNGVDDAVELTKFMVGAYEAYNTGKKYVF